MSVDKCSLISTNTDQTISAPDLSTVWKHEKLPKKPSWVHPRSHLCASGTKDLLVHADPGEDAVLLGILWETIQEFSNVIFTVHPNTLGAGNPTEDTTALALGQKSHRILGVALFLLDVHLQCGAVNEIEMFQLRLSLPVPSLDNLGRSHGIRKGMVRDEIIKLLALPCFYLVHESTNP